MKILPLLTLALTTTATVVGFSTEAHGADQTQRSMGAIHQVYNTHKIDEAHWDLLVAVAKRGTVVRYNTSECQTGDANGFELGGYYGWDNGRTEMVLCDHDGDKQAMESLIRHEVGHKVQDLKDGVRGDGRLSPWYNTQDPEFWAFYSKSGNINHEYVESYKKGGDMENYRLEADAEVQQTETAAVLIDRLFRF